MEFRIAQASDVKAIVTLVESAYRGDSSRVGWTTEADLLDGQRTDSAAVHETIAADDRLVLLAVDSITLLACCELRRRTDGTAYFGMFAVSPALQGGGIGKLVLAEAERWVRDEWSARRLVMTVIAQRGDLIAWYERRGYLRTGVIEPFPYGDERFGLPKRPDLVFETLAKALAPTSR